MLAGFCQTVIQLKKKKKKTVWLVSRGQPAVHFLPGSFLFGPLDKKTSGQRYARDFSWIYVCWLVEITQCLYAATLMTPSRPAECSTTQR